MITWDMGQLLNAFQKISSLAKGVFTSLRCRIGDFGEQTKGGNIGEIAFVELTDISQAKGVGVARCSISLPGLFANFSVEAKSLTVPVGR